jgi:hypothetical protein
MAKDAKWNGNFPSVEKLEFLQLNKANILKLD